MNVVTSESENKVTQTLVTLVKHLGDFAFDIVLFAFPVQKIYKFIAFEYKLPEDVKFLWTKKFTSRPNNSLNLGKCSNNSQATNMAFALLKYDFDYDSDSEDENNHGAELKMVFNLGLGLAQNDSDNDDDDDHITLEPCENESAQTESLTELKQTDRGPQYSTTKAANVNAKNKSMTETQRAFVEP